MKVSDTFNIFEMGLILQIANALRELEAHLCAYTPVCKHWFHSWYTISSRVQFFLLVYSFLVVPFTFLTLSGFYFQMCFLLVLPPSMSLASFSVGSCYHHCSCFPLSPSAAPARCQAWSRHSVLSPAGCACCCGGRESPCELFDTLGTWHLWEVKK